MNISFSLDILTLKPTRFKLKDFTLFLIYPSFHIHSLKRSLNP